MPKLNKRDSRTSSGNRKTSRIMRQLMRLKMKVNRWNRYTEEMKAGKRKGDLGRWNTAGLKKHMALLEKLI